MTKYLDSVAVDESYVLHIQEGMTAKINWLPHLEKIRSKKYRNTENERKKTNPKRKKATLFEKMAKSG